LVLQILRRKTGLRTAIGIAAAYALVLQMVLVAVLAPQMAMASVDGLAFSAICHSDGTADDGTGPANAARHNACAVCVQAHAAPGLAPLAATLPVRIASAARFVVVPPHAPARQRQHDPRSSQGPPQIA
jgi:hypothetical protein